MNKRDYPRAITDLFGIAPKSGTGGYWMSRNDTVSEEWVRLIAEKVGVRYTGDKVTTMRAMVQAVGQRWDAETMASTLTPSGGGGNISKPAFEALYLGLQKHPEVVAAERARRNRLAREAEAALRVLPVPDRADDMKVSLAILARRGQQFFRHALIRAYAGTCAISGCNAKDALEAAHIRQYEHGGTYETSNGILLRADLHTLFDLHLLSINVDAPSIDLAPSLAATTYGEESQAWTWRPATGPDAPDPSALREHRSACRF